MRADMLKPRNLLWIFGAGRTGSTWLSAMMGEMPGHGVWFEPMVGELFDPDRMQVGVRGGQDFVFADRYRRQWLRSIRRFVLDAANVRFPEPPEVLVVKEPHGSAGAPLLSAALPQSRFVLLVRDPQDTIASALERYLHGAWRGTGGKGMYREPETTPDGFVEQAARSYLRHVSAAKSAYDAHAGPRAMLRYEDLKADPLSEMRRVYSRAPRVFAAGRAGRRRRPDRGG